MGTIFLVLKRDLHMRKLIQAIPLRKAAARCLLEVLQCGLLRKTPTDSSSSPSGEGCREQQRQVS